MPNPPVILGIELILRGHNSKSDRLPVSIEELGISLALHLGFF